MIRKVFEGSQKITSTYLEKRSGGKYHGGLDIVGLTSSKVYAPFKCKIVAVGWENSKNKKQGYGYRIWAQITEDGKYKGYHFVLGHLKASSSKVKVGQTVKARTHVATMGNTGSSTGAHLHFEIRKSAGSKANRLNPAYALSTPNKKGTYKLTYNIVKGSAGYDVELFQKGCNKYGYTDSKKKKLTADGKAGDKTVQAGNKVKKKAGWKQNGVFGKKTRQKAGAYKG